MIRCDSGRSRIMARNASFYTHLMPLASLLLRPNRYTTDSFVSLYFIIIIIAWPGILCLDVNNLPLITRNLKFHFFSNPEGLHVYRKKSE
jgi:hypothetical protein